MSTASEKWSAMNDDLRNEWIATNVMLWTRANRLAMGRGDGPVVFITGEDPDDPNSNPTVQDPHFTTDSADDYLVLQRVRETWDAEAKCTFSYQLQRLMALKRHEGPLIAYAVNYEPGDYSAAAYLALSETGEAK